ncbi:MAG: VWA domain-containing protein [Roseovarius sp.]|uniref:vWA domain-containing protein n=1 Tax=Roseovarius sp. TaxID=1486281 RepID=UPI0032ECEB62
MTDDLDDLKQAMQAATPAPDAGRKAANFTIAQDNFDRLQESRAGVRLTSDRPGRGWFRGVARMITTQLSSRGMMSATTALVALGLVVVVPDWQAGRDMFRPGPMVQKTVATEEDRARQAQEAVGGLAEMEAAESLAADDMAGAAPPSPAPRMQAAPTEALRGFAAETLNNTAPAGQRDVLIRPENNTEAYAHAEPNTLKVTAEDPVSTFSIDVDTASYAVVRSSLIGGVMPPHEAVRIEEMINYFPYDYAAPVEGEAPFRSTVSVTDTPWNPDTQLVHIGIQGELPAVEDRPPLNLVFLIDTSGSMEHPDKLPLLKQSLALMLSKLSAQDQVSIVTYAGSAGQVLEPTSAAERDTILGALDNLSAGGNTAGQEGLQQAYAVAEGMTEEGEVSRVILATDGDFNVGISDPDELERYIAGKRESGTYLSVLGFGRGNLDDAVMQSLAQNGNGQAAYIDTLSEAQKVLVDQFTGALYPIADDVKIQVEFNPGVVAEYRLIGYETRALNRDDFNNDSVDAGDIGAGHSVTAIYEVTLVDSDGRLTDPLRYGDAETQSTSDELGYLKLRYKAPGEETSQLIETPIVAGGETTDDMRFAAAIAGFGQILQDSPYLNGWSYEDAIALANSAKGEDAYGYRAEAVRLMRLAQSLDRD